ncbi:YneF family protein [Tumebacillus lipolyticus]|uniref:YneF family protein n=1 Tax=Tumebacillus lipolyticus TaxID=1280370 RepID=A0ABW5A173_9BACL
MVTTLIAIGTLLVGLILGALGGVYYLKKKMQNMQMSDKEVQAMARSMGMNLNQKQLAQVTKRMQSANNAKPKKKK